MKKKLNAANKIIILIKPIFLKTPSYISSDINELKIK